MNSLPCSQTLLCSSTRIICHYYELPRQATHLPEKRQKQKKLLRAFASWIRHRHCRERSTLPHFDGLKIFPCTETLFKKLVYMSDRLNPPPKADIAMSRLLWQ